MTKPQDRDVRPWNQPNGSTTATLNGRPIIFATAVFLFRPLQHVTLAHICRFNALTVANNTRAINFIWTLIAGFLVMFMQAGFALVETGMCRAKNVAHTMSMNFLVYSLAMIGFFVCGYAFMMGGVNAVPAGVRRPLIGGPQSLGLSDGHVLNHMLYIHIAGKHWGISASADFSSADIPSPPGRSSSFST